MLRRLSRSLSFRLLLIFLLLGSLFVLGTINAIQRFYNSDDIRGLISGHLSLHVQYVRDDIGTPPSIERALAITERVPVDIRIAGPSIQWASNENFPAIADLDFEASPRFSDDPSGWVDELQGVTFSQLGDHRFLRMQQGGYDIIVSTPRISDVNRGPDLILQILVLGLTFLLIGYFAVQWLFRPIRAIREGAAHIGGGNFDHRISKVRRDQLGDLAEDINKLAGDVEDMLNAKRGLLLGISHELRTPLSRIRLTTEFVDDEDQAESLRAEISEMEKIVTALLEAERLNDRHSELVRTDVNVGELVELMLEDFFSRDRDRITLRAPDEPVLARIDDVRITLMLKNLLSNALRYSLVNAGPVELAYREKDGELEFEVHDHGPGISAEDAAHIGEAFYRGDPSRARKSGGFGLGLYLATLVARAHGGNLQLMNPGDVGARFVMRIPAA